MSIGQESDNKIQSSDSAPVEKVGTEFFTDVPSRKRNHPVEGGPQDGPGIYESGM